MACSHRFVALSQAMVMVKVSWSVPGHGHDLTSRICLPSFESSSCRSISCAAQEGRRRTYEDVEGDRKERQIKSEHKAKEGKEREGGRHRLRHGPRWSKTRCLRMIVGKIT